MRTVLLWLRRGLLLAIALLAVVVLYWAAGQNSEIESQENLIAAEIAPGQLIEVAGRQMHVLIKGQLDGDPTGAPLVLLHGFSASGHTTWLPWANRLAAAPRTVILIDMLNFGYSERVTKPHPDLTHRGQAALINGLLDALGVKQVDLTGWSMGGAVASQFVLDYPDRVRAVAFIAAHIYGFDRFNPFEFLGTLPFGIGRAMSWNSVGGSPNGFVARTCAAKQEQCHWWEPLLIIDTVDGLQAISATQQDTRLPDDIPLIDKPVLVIAGEVDDIVPMADNERLVAELDAEFYVAEGAGHWPGEREPNVVADVVLNFFRTQAGRDVMLGERLPARHELTWELQEIQARATASAQCRLSSGSSGLPVSGSKRRSSCQPPATSSSDCQNPTASPASNALPIAVVSSATGRTQVTPRMSACS